MTKRVKNETNHNRVLERIFGRVGDSFAKITNDGAMDEPHHVDETPLTALKRIVDSSVDHHFQRQQKKQVDRENG